MPNLAFLKRHAIATGTYRLARLAHRYVLSPGSRRRFREEQRFIRELLRPGALCFDVGANIGEKSEAFLAAGMRVVAFEPQPDCMAELKARCGHYRNIQCVPKAVSSRAGHAQLHVDPGSSALSSLKAGWTDTAAQAITVQTTTLSDAIQQHGRPDYCKVDVEGWEIEVFRGLDRPIPIISFEYHLRDEDIDSVFECLSQLQRFGDFQLNVSQPDPFRLIHDQWLDYVAFKKFFPDGLRGDDRLFYGDIFVKYR